LVFEEGGMDMSKPLSYLFQHRIRRKKGDTAQLAAQLAPLEEQDKRRADSALNDKRGGASQESGAIVVDRNSLTVPKEMMESPGTKGFFGMERVVLVILGVMLAFIAFVAWQISQMPVE
jgi:hypothetical protein